MKKLMLILLVVFLFTNFDSQAQNPVLNFKNVIVTIDGETHHGNIESYLGKKIIFYKDKENVKRNTIPVEEIAKINGPVPKNRMIRMLKDNPNISFDKDLDVSLYQDPIYNLEKERLNNLRKTPGDLIKSSASLRMTGLGVGIATGIILATGAIEDTETAATISVIAGVAGLSLYIAGEITQIKAGKLMNQERISITPASEGIGLSINF